MARHLTLKRSSPLDIIHVPVLVAFGGFMKAARIHAELDTGNDHTCIRRDVLNELGLPIIGRPMAVHGVTGQATGTVVRISLGFEMDDGHRCVVEEHEVVVLDTMSCPCLLGRDVLRIFDVELRSDGTTILKLA